MVFWTAWHAELGVRLRLKEAVRIARFFEIDTTGLTANQIANLVFNKADLMLRIRETERNVPIASVERVEENVKKIFLKFLK